MWNGKFSSLWIVIFIDFHYVAVKHGFCKIIFDMKCKKDSHFVVNRDFHWVWIAFFCELWIVNCENTNLLPVKCHLEPRLPPSSVFIVLWVQFRPFAPWNKVIVITGHLPYLMAKTLHDSGSFCPGGWGWGWGYFRTFWVGMCCWHHGTLSLY